MSSENRKISPNAFGERGAAFEQKSRAAILKSIEQSIEDPADPEVFFHMLHRRAESCGNAEE